MVLGVCLALGYPVRAAQCRLIQVTQVDLGTDGTGAPTVPVTIAGHSYTFALGLDVSFSWMSPRLVEALYLETKLMPAGIGVKINGKPARREAEVTDFNFGALHADRFTMIEAPPDVGQGVDGTVGLDVLSRFDVDLDLKAGKLTLFSQEHCPGVVVYWTDQYAVLPFLKDEIRHPYFAATLDDRKVTIAFAPESSVSTMGQRDARDVFGIEADDPKFIPMTPGEDEKSLMDEFGKDKKYFRYPFRHLSLGGLTIDNPAIVLFSQSPAEQCHANVPHVPSGGAVIDFGEHCFGATTLRLGRAQIRHLHLYYAFKEKKLYVSAADAPPAAAAQK
jgi:hypothetical protein